MLAGSTEPFGWAICDGGSVKLAEAMAAHLRDHGGEIRVDATVRQIEVDGWLARAPSCSTTATRDSRSTGVLVSNLDPKHTFLELVGEQDLPTRVHARSSTAGATTRCAMFCLYLALDEPVRWKARVRRSRSRALLRRLDVRGRSTVLDDNASDCRLGVPPRQPGLFSVHTSLFEPSLCPPGKEACFLRADRAVRASRRRPPRPGRSSRLSYADFVLDRWRPVPRLRPRARARRRPLHLEPDRHRARHALA